MTSSLVGSEMCIRDRFRTQHVLIGKCKEGAVAVAACSATGEENHVTRSPHPFIPVSYTHLTLPTICSV
eukprot:11896212-Prorocentrum_lima.AAC.1